MTGNTNEKDLACSVKPGVKKVWVGDPCYVISDKDWDGFMTQMFKGHESLEFDELEGENGAILAESTYWGDGCYQGGDKEYGVDAGMLAIVPENMIGKTELLDAGSTYEFDQDVKEITMKTSEDGEFRFGVILADGTAKEIEFVMTGPEPEDEEEDEENEWDVEEEDEEEEN